MSSAQRSIGSGNDSITFTGDPTEIADAGAAVAFMRGRLKAEGDTGRILQALESGAVDDAFAAPQEAG